MPVVAAIDDFFAPTGFQWYIDFPAVTDEDPNDSFSYELINLADSLSITSTVPGVTLDLPNNRISIAVAGAIYQGFYNLRFRVTDDDTVLEGNTKQAFVDF